MQEEETKESKPAGKPANKTPLIAVIAGLVVVFIAVAVFALAGSSEPTERPAGSRYIDWSETAFEDHADGQRWLNFHADWCPNCRALNTDIEANLDDIPADVIIFKVDYDNNQDLKQRYGINRQTTIVSVNENGDQLDSFLAVGSETLAALVDRLYIEPTGGDKEMTDNDNDQGSETSQSDPAPTEEEQATADPAPVAPPSPRYVDWSETAFEEHADGQRWLNFHADWCPNCRALNTDIEANLDDIPADVIIFKVDYDSNQDLRQRYGVNRQTTIVSVDENGDQVKSFLAVGSETLAALIEELY